jgi:hypothetical protein
MTGDMQTYSSLAHRHEVPHTRVLA